MITQIAETMSTFFYRTKIIELEEKEKNRGESYDRDK